MRLRHLVLAAVVVSCSDSTGPKPDEIFTVVSGNGFSCALVGTKVYCWGRNDAGQLGRNTTGPDLDAGPVSGDHQFKLLTASERTACGVTTADVVLCWGNGRIFGFSTPVAVPTPISGAFPLSITSIGLGYSHGCALSTGGIATCFGINSEGELGNGTVQPSTVAGATTVIGAHSFSQLSVGAIHNCGLEGSAVWCWGWNFGSSFGPNTTSGATYSTPFQVTLTFSAQHIEAGSAVTCAFDASAQAWCWGDNVAGQLGRGAGTASQSSPDPTLISQVSKYAVLSMPRLNSTISHTCGIDLAGATFCWGLGDFSQIGRPATESCVVSATSSVACSGAPGAIASTKSFTQLAPGRDHTCGITVQGEIYCWGSDAHRQLGGSVGTTSQTAVRIAITQ